MVFVPVIKNGLCGGEILLLRPNLLEGELEYNHKIDYLMCKWLVPPRKNHREFRLRDVFYEKTKAKTNDEMRIIAFKSAFLFLCENKVGEAVEILRPFANINFAQALTTFDETNGKRVDFNLLAYLLSRSTLPFPYVILYYNSLRVKGKLCPLILRKDQAERIIRLLREREFHAAQEIYKICLCDSERHLIKKRPYSLEEISAIIKSTEEKLKVYKIAEVHLFGSYARDEASQYSDLDIVVVTRRTVVDNDYLFGLQSVLEGVLKIPLDLHLFQNRIDYSNFDKKMRDDMVKIL